ncbi:MAG: hypothetical protein GY856_51255, partial [bacterium]|nr:hypothetical protein [bacterium]
LRWQPVDAAVAYRVEIGRDAELRDLVTSPQRAERAEHRLTGLDNGHYYWRVASIDELGFPGPRGRARRLRILRDTTPPFLRIESPRPGTSGTVASADAPITVVGKTEPSARVDCGGESVVVEPSGRFAHSLRLGPGEQTLVVEATDPAGNRTRREVRVARDAPSGTLAFASDLPQLGTGVFVARGPEFVLSGTGRPHADLRVVGEAWTGRTRTDAQGSFRLLVPLRSERQDFEVTVGDGEPRKRFAVVVDREPPVLEVAAP